MYRSDSDVQIVGPSQCRAAGLGVRTDCFYILLHSKGFANTTGYKNEQVDKPLEEGRNTYEQAARKKIYDELQEILVKDIPMFSLFYSVEYAALRDNVHDFVWIPDQIPRFRDLWKKGH
jgi:peptide/nickel transport system substrate-binding protein